MQSEVLNVINDLKLDMTASSVDDVTIITRAQLEALEAALSAAEPVRWMWEERRFAESDIWDDMYDDDPPAPHKHVRNIRPLYAAPLARSVSVKSLQWDDDGGNLKARMGDREWMLNVTSDGETWAGSTRPFVFGRNLTWSSVPNCSMVSLEAAKAACQADCQARYAALSAQVQDVAGNPIGYMRKQDNDGNSFWVHRVQNAYYSEPVYAAAPAKQEGCESKPVHKPTVDSGESGDE
ncbi:hypothetical protein J5288_08755 [Agrobacterium sp. S2/73]|uniref:hypothetical protein n=1 Tax=unclassified Agrobacterium TaxID=2632611 RepID=UPI001AD95CFD|nr:MULTISPECIES: hypothetical protein [unclassified Agrobacterium]MBO9108792.1 hypothetical protein [Agrobacterium sp. S2/73]QXZ73451.1 hypothetical protein J5276_05755 [Agrobacterium sp. S7/73]